jgi:hypothetical protein
LGTTVKSQNCIHEEVKSRLNSGNPCYYSVQSTLSLCLLSKSLEIKIHKTILSVVLYGCETLSPTLREEDRVMVFGIRVLGRIFGPKGEDVTRGWKNFIMKSFITCTFHQMLLR